MNDKIDIEMAEDEDLARAKAWWKENGSSIIAGIAIGTAMVVGYNYWQTYQQQHSIEVAQLYEAYSKAPQETEVLNQLIEKDGAAVYAQLARLTSAKQAVEKSEFGQAEQLLNEVIESGTAKGLRIVAALRLASVYLAQDKPADALSLLEAQDNSELPLEKGRIAELKADAYSAQGNQEKAKEYYENSIELLTEARQAVTLVQLKLDNL